MLTSEPSAKGLHAFLASSSSVFLLFNLFCLLSSTDEDGMESEIWACASARISFEGISPTSLFFLVVWRNFDRCCLLVFARSDRILQD
jgi:hypothetical protein